MRFPLFPAHIQSISLLLPGKYCVFLPSYGDRLLQLLTFALLLSLFTEKAEAIEETLSMEALAEGFSIEHRSSRRSTLKRNTISRRSTVGELRTTGRRSR